MKQYMKSLLNLTAFELDRISKFLYTLLGVTLLLNLIGYIYTPMRYVGRMNEYMQTESVTAQQAIERFGSFSFYDVTSTLWLLAPATLGISGLLLYSLFIWYREWMGKNTFAYRLLMLPVPRMQIFYSKLFVIYIAIFSLIAVQIISLTIGFQIVSAIVPDDWMSSMTLIQALNIHPLFTVILPVSSFYFLSANGIGLTFVLVLFTVILLERSYSFKGLGLGIAYGVVTVLIAAFPVFLPDLVQNYYLFYDSEIMALIIVLMTVIGVTSLLISRHLLNKKITI